MNRRVSNIFLALYIAGGGLVATSCEFFSKKSEDEEVEGKPVARVYDRYLYEKDIQDIVPKGLEKNDSLAFLQNYINVWAKDQLMIYKAEYNLTENKKNFEKQIEEYRNDLLKFTYRQDYVRQHLDTSISDKALREYYEKGEANLVLQENVLKVRYLVVDRQAPGLQQATEWFHSDEQEAQQKLEEFALKYAYKFSLHDSIWVNLDRIRKLMPVEIEDPEDFLSSQQIVELKDSTNLYLLEIIEYRLKGEKSPLEYSWGVIENILLNKRKLDLIHNLEQNLLNDALEKKEFDVY